MGQKRASITALKTLGVLIALAYFLTSGVVFINAFIWTPTLPDMWYRLQAVLYWPFGPLFEAASRAGMPYGNYVLVTRGPFLVLSALAALLILRSGKRREAS